MLENTGKLLAYIAAVIATIDAAWMDDCLNAHNTFRANDRPNDPKPPMKLNQTLCSWANKRAQELSAQCAFSHDGNKDSGYGENLAAGYSDCKTTVKQWTDESGKYSRSYPGYQKAAGHYTQVVWRDTLNVCCAMKSHCQYRYVTVCTYWKPGNVDTREEFQRNV